VSNPQLLEKFAKDERLEQLSAQKRRMRQQEHKREIDRLIEANRKKRELEKLLDVDFQAKNRELEQFRLNVVEQERQRQRLLREHASKLVGFLPKVRRVA
jgi:Tfp pilus assembly pilus retraction ATPase PilT